MKKFEVKDHEPLFLIKDEFVDDAFIVDFVRVFDRVKK